MKRFSPRSVVWLIMLAALAVGPTIATAEYVQPQIEHKPYGSVKMVVPLTSADPKTWTFKLHNISNSIEAVQEHKGTLDIRVELYGPGIKLLINPDQKIQTAVDQLRSEGVQFEVCNNTLKGMNVDWHQLYGVKEKDIVPAGFLEVGWLGNHGWSVNPMN